jgi:2-phosphosulfolactate phosphatase
LKIYAAFLPQGLTYESGDVCVVIDAIRAGATLAAMAEVGDPVVYLAIDARQARRFRDESNPGALLGGEEGGIAPAGFDLGNSPEEWSKRDLRGERVVFGTSNGTRAVSRCADADHVLVASFNNVSAVARRAGALAGRRVKIVCAGQGGFIALDDAVCAGLIARQLMREGGEVADSAVMAMAVADQFEDIPAVVRRSESGRRLLDVGYDRDLEWCARVDITKKVPELAKDDVTIDRRLVLV